MIWLLLTGILTVLIYYKFVRTLSYWKNLGVKQTKPWPLLGDSWTALFRTKTFSEWSDWIYSLHPGSRYIGCYQFTQPMLYIKDSELIKQMMVKDFDHFVDRRSFVDPEADPLWDGNVFALKGQRWREMRATLSGSFTSSKMKNMFHLMEEAAEKFVQFFLDKNENAIDIEMKDTYTRYTNDVIATAAFGIECNSLTEPKNDFYEMGKAITNFGGLLFILKFMGYSLLPKLFKSLHIPIFDQAVASYFKSVINETIKTREEKGIVRPDMINLLLETRKGIKQEESEAIETGFATVQESAHIGKFKQIRHLTNDDITSQALIFFFAGFDTVSTALCFGSHELALNKYVQDQLRNEIYQAYKNSNKNLTYDILLKMKYMDMVVSEILRKWAPAPVMDRCCTKSYTIEPVTSDEKPVHINVGDIVLLPIHSIHRDPTHYLNPEKFDPERFSDENKDSIKPYTYMPFGVGPRNCIGSRFALLEVKALLFHLLLNFEIVPIKKTQIPIKLDRKSIQHTAEGGFWLGLKRVRNNN